MEHATEAARARPMPRAKGLPLVGALPQILLRPLDFLEETVARRGSVFEIDLGVTRAVVVADVDAVEHVLLTHTGNYGKGGEIWEGIREVLGRGLGSSEGELWRRQRKLMQPKFQRSFLEGVRDTIAETIEDELDGLRSDEPIDLARWTDGLLATLAVRVLFGSDLDPAKVDEVRTTMAAVSDSVIQGLVTRKLPRWLPLTGRERLSRARRIFDHNVAELIAERRRHPRPSKDLLGLLLGATDEQGSMSDEQLRDEAITFYIAGYETTGTALAWTLWLLAGHPHVRDALLAELDGGSTEAPLLHACMQEGLRLYPPALFVIRHTVGDDVLLGHPVRAGTPVLVSPWLVHHNPAIWPDPKRFDPERFLSPAPERSRLAWIPFGAGQRICIGKALAMLELEEGLRRVLRDFTPTLSDGCPAPRPRLSTALRSSTGIFVRMVPRRAAHPPIAPPTSR